MSKTWADLNISWIEFVSKSSKHKSGHGMGGKIGYFPAFILIESGERCLKAWDHKQILLFGLNIQIVEEELLCMLHMFFK